MSGNIFDCLDVFYLANRFSVSQLRQEIRQAEIKTKVADTCLDTEYQTGEDLFPWADYADCCGEAIKAIQQSTREPAPGSTPARRIDTEAIKAKNDIVTIIERYTRLRKAGKNFTGKCPIHQDKQPSLTVYPDNQTWHCYGCNRGGDVLSFIMKVENCDFKQAAKVLEAKQ